MNKKSIKYFSCVAGILICGAVQASEMTERETNHPISQAQNIIPGLGETIVHGVIGVKSGVPQADLDFYRIYGRAGDVITVDIDGGIGGERSVDTYIAI